MRARARARAGNTLQGRFQLVAATVAALHLRIRLAITRLFRKWRQGRNPADRGRAGGGRAAQLNFPRFSPLVVGPAGVERKKSPIARDSTSKY